MLGLIAAALMAPAPATPTSDANEAILESAIPWWERITVLVDDKGRQQSCRYETSVTRAADCDRAMADSIKTGGKARAGIFSKVTFERRFSPDRPDAGRMQPGDTLLGRQMMFLTFDEAGAIASCKVIATSGATPPAYDCEQVRKERFSARAPAEPAPRQAFLTVLAYGHSEYIA